MHEIVTLNMDNPAVQYLCEKDKRLAKVISMVGEVTYKPYADGYSFLVHEIIEQMLSVKAGARIYDRLLVLCNGCITPECITALSDEAIKSTGTSNAKVKYIKCLTSAITNKQIDLSQLPALSDSEVMRQLTNLRGIGSWTAKMYLIFVLDRPNVLPYEDAAFLQGFKWAYKVDILSKEKIKQKCKKWNP
ncbi:MAG: hypothetical protein NC416_15205, partial [Eubacterium sp.]|nr:hypothetical protein [Eubacterium sp.]